MGKKGLHIGSVMCGSRRATFGAAVRVLMRLSLQSPGVFFSHPVFYFLRSRVYQICADVKISLNLTPKMDTRLSLKKLDAEEQQGAIYIHPSESLSASCLSLVLYCDY